MTALMGEWRGPQAYGGPANWCFVVWKRCGGDPSVVQIATAISMAVKTDLAAIDFPCMMFDQAER